MKKGDSICRLLLQIIWPRRVAKKGRGKLRIRRDEGLLGLGVLFFFEKMDIVAYFYNDENNPVEAYSQCKRYRRD